MAIAVVNLNFVEAAFACLYMAANKVEPHFLSIMANDQHHNETALPDEVAQNPGARMAATRANPHISQEEAENATAGESPNASGMGPSTAEEHVPASSDPQATDLPTSNAPHPEQANPQNPNAS